MSAFDFDLQTAVYAGALLVLVATVAVLILGFALTARKATNRIGKSWGKEHVKVVEWSGDEGYVEAGGELWRAKSEDLLSPGDEVSVTATRGLVLDVRRRRSEQGE